MDRTTQFPITITTPEAILTFTAQALGLRPRRYTVAWNPICSSYLLEYRDGTPPINDVITYYAAPQDLNTARNFLELHGTQITALMLVDQDRPKRPFHFEPYRGHAQIFRGTDWPQAPPAANEAEPLPPDAPTTSPIPLSHLFRRNRSRPPPAPSRPSTAGSSPPPNVVRRGISAGPSRSDPQLPKRGRGPR
ncbi:hypothetical protein [Pistacia-associated flexivirus 1]|uniref:Uncharacterized protein n=1 Tax=Entoleuca gammaflexivirus 2 TaxID=2086642 RepID=A0AAD0ZYZ9_9VIRU|nr:hypothetical protein QKP89_gp2 [Entoleuca gammaflexivirus 2]AZG06256.1 hypothetical protein [Entoleuca gammaflexivirus 2]